MHLDRRGSLGIRLCWRIIANGSVCANTAMLAVLEGCGHRGMMRRLRLRLRLRLLLLPLPLQTADHTGPGLTVQGAVVVVSVPVGLVALSFVGSCC